MPSDEEQTDLEQQEKDKGKVQEKIDPESLRMIYKLNHNEIIFLEDAIFRLIKYYFVVMITMVVFFSINALETIQTDIFLIVMFGLVGFLIISSYFVCGNVLSIVHIELRNLNIEKYLKITIGNEHEAFLVSKELRDKKVTSNSFIIKVMEIIAGKDSKAYQTYLFNVVMASYILNSFIGFLVTLIVYKICYAELELPLYLSILIGIAFWFPVSYLLYQIQIGLLNQFFNDITVLPYEDLMRSIGWDVKYKPIETKYQHLIVKLLSRKS